MLKTISMQHATFCHSNQHCETSLSVLRTQETNFCPKPAKKTGKNRAKTGQNRSKPVKFRKPSHGPFLAFLNNFCPLKM